MKAFTVAAAVVCILVAGVASAQTAQTAQPPAKPAATAPQTPAKPAAPAAASAAPPAPVEAKFPEGARFAFINIQRIASDSIEGKASSSKLEALRAKKASDLNDRNKAIEGLQAKQKSTVMSDEARAQAQKEIDRIQVEIQRMTQDAQQEMQDMQNELQVDFQRKVAPIIQLVAQEKSIQMLFSQGDSGLVWADTGLDLTNEVIRRFDAVAAAAKPAPAAPIKK